jgi:N-glycosylase/DNA lyase
MWLPLKQPLDLESSLESGQAFRWRRRGGWWEGVLGWELVWLRQGPGRLEYRTDWEPPEAIAPALLRYFRLDDDLPAIQRSLSWDPRVAEAVRRHPGLRLLRQEPWECLVSFICSSNSNIPRITGTIEGLCQAFGRPVELGRRRRFTFPTPEALAGAGQKALERLGLGYRAGYVARTAQIIAGGSLTLEALREAPYEEAKRALLALPGVGEKVADCVLLFSLEKLEAFPVDVWVRKALREYPEARKVKDAKLAAWARERFGPRAGYAQQYLFHRRRREG